MSITREQAIEKAAQVGVEAYGDIEMFEMTVDENPTHWFVNFTNPRATEDGERQHFAVWIDKKTGESRLFRGR